MKLKSIFSQDSVIMLICLASLFCSYPYVLNRLLSLPDVKTIGPAMLALSFLCLLFCKERDKKRIPNFIVLFTLVQSFVWAFYSLIYTDSTYITRIFFLIWSFALLQLLLKCNCFKKFASINGWIVAIQALGGLSAFVLVFLGLLSPVIFYSLENGQDGFCYVLTCTNVVLDNVIRAAGYFDEPGALAFWGIFTLLINQMFIKNRYIEYSIIIGLLSTLSAAFFIQVTLYFLLFKTNSFKKALPVIVFIAIVFVVLQHTLDNDYIAKYTLDRFHGGQVNSTRYGLSDIAKTYFLSSPIFGIGAAKMQSITYMGDNPYEILASDGIVGYIITYMPLLYVLLKYKNKELLYAILILMAGYMQRPFHQNLMHYFYLYSFCLICYYKYGKQNNEIS